MVDLSQDAGENESPSGVALINKKKIRLSHERATKRTMKGAVEQLVPKSNKGRSSKRKREKVQIELSREKRMGVLRRS